MFSGLRQGVSFYVLDKNGDKPVLKIGQVTSVSNPQPKFGQLQSYQIQQPDTVVDISVKFPDGSSENYNQLPSNLSIANFGSNGVVVSESREAMIQEVDTMKRTSQQVLDSISYHQSVIESCDEMNVVLNPNVAKEREQEQKIAGLEGKISGMETQLFDIKQMLADALSKSTNNKK